MRRSTTANAPPLKSGKADDLLHNPLKRASSWIHFVALRDVLLNLRHGHLDDLLRGALLDALLINQQRNFSDLLVTRETSPSTVCSPNALLNALLG